MRIMYQLLQSQKQALQLMWAQIAPCEPTADVTPADALALRDLWIKIAPHELHRSAATALELKGHFEQTHNIPGFFAPDADEMEAFEDSYQKHADSYIIWK